MNNIFGEYVAERDKSVSTCAENKNSCYDEQEERWLVSLLRANNQYALLTNDAFRNEGRQCLPFLIRRRNVVGHPALLLYASCNQITYLTVLRGIPVAESGSNNQQKGLVLYAAHVVVRHTVNLQHKTVRFCNPHIVLVRLLTRLTWHCCQKAVRLIIKYSAREHGHI